VSIDVSGMSMPSKSTPSYSVSSIGPKEDKMLPGEAVYGDFDAIELLACVSFDLSTALRTDLGSLKIAQQTVADLHESIK
jgi:hypothetical protein